MIKSLNVSPDVFGRIQRALIDTENETRGEYDFSSSPTPNVDILYFSTPLSIDDAKRIAGLTDPVPIIVDWNRRLYAEIKEEFSV